MSAADNLIDQFAPYLADDDGSLVAYLTACAYGRELVDDIVRDTPEGVGWSSLLDPDRAPTWALRWLAQFVGVQAAPGTDETWLRQAIRTPAGWRRGTIQAIRDAVGPLLTGGRTIIIIERAGGAWSAADNPYHFTVATFIDETPDPAAVVAAVGKQKPAGMVASVVTITHWVLLTIQANYASLNAVSAAFATLDALKAGP
jgi:hypothetical protein